jgi:hypothetical protein
MQLRRFGADRCSRCHAPANISTSNGKNPAVRLLVDIPNKVRDILGIMVDVHLFEENGKEFVQIGVEAYPNPISIPPCGWSFGFYPTHGARHPKTTGEVTGEVERLVLAVKGPMSRVQIQLALGLRHEDHFRAKYLIPALQNGFVE